MILTESLTMTHMMRAPVWLVYNISKDIKLFKTKEFNWVQYRIWTYIYNIIIYHILYIHTIMRIYIIYIYTRIIWGYIRYISRTSKTSSGCKCVNTEQQSAPGQRLQLPDRWTKPRGWYCTTKPWKTCFCFTRTLAPGMPWSHKQHYPDRRRHQTPNYFVKIF